jgi:uncharacterized protein (TIGR03503 family)
MCVLKWRRVLAALIALSLSTWALSASSEATEVDAPDTRVLIDVSGSMKKNDPQYLRRPALRLLVELLPDDSRAGVWTFGRWVNMEVPLGKVDQAWKRRAREGAARIHSRGQFTNIEEALKRSIVDWQGATRKYDRHLILLTDGMVDVSKNPKESAASRARILSEILPRIKEHGARIHTIALSERADHELLQSLASETDGWYEQVNEAAQLQRIFLRLFEKVGKPDTIPLKDNRFQVDGSIQEVTLLVFRSEEGGDTRVITPTGKEFGSKEAPESVSWHRDEGYDLMTISQPEVGEWRVLAAVDPDNRVMVVTDLKMKSTDLPNRLLQGERVPLMVHFVDQKKKITRKEFLDVVNLKSEHTDSEGVGEPRPIFDDGKDADQVAGDGDFTLRLGEGIADGKVELVVSAQGKTFTRERRYTFEVIPAAKLDSSVEERDGKSGVMVKVTPDAELIDPQTVRIEGTLVSKEGESQPVMFVPSAEQNSQESWVDSTTLEGTWSLGVRFLATGRSGKELALDLGPVQIEGSYQPPPPPPEPEPEPEPVPEPEPEPEPEPPVQEEPPVEKEPPSEEDGWTSGLIIFGIGNLLLLLAGGAGFWFWRRRTAGNALQVEEEEGEDVELESGRQEAEVENDAD